MWSKPIAVISHLVARAWFKGEEGDSVLADPQGEIYQGASGKFLLLQHTHSYPCIFLPPFLPWILLSEGTFLGAVGSHLGNHEEKAKKSPEKLNCGP